MLERTDFSTVERKFVVSEDHWAVLAATRFLLALIVVHCHYRLIVPGLTHPTSTVAIGFGGTAAVFSFLLISGFSIAHSIEASDAGFYKRRFARIWPVLFAAVVLELAAEQTLSRSLPNLWIFWTGLPTLLFLNGFTAAVWLSPTWSLSIEVAYYVAAPLIRRLPSLMIGALVCASALLHWFNPVLGIGPYGFVKYGIGAMAVFWAWGAGYLAMRHFNNWSVNLAVVLIGPVMIGAYGSGDGPYAAVTWAFTASALIYGREIILSDRMRKIATYLGDISYPLFLTHFGVITFSAAAGISSWFIVIPTSLIVAIVTFHYVDRPARRYIASSNLFGKAPEKLAPYLLGLLVIACATSAWLHQK